MEVVNGGGGFTTPNAGTGAVIFNYPRDTPFDTEKNVIADLDEYNQRKAQAQAAKAAQTSTLLSGLKLNPDGAMAQHIPELQQGGQKIFETAAQLMQKYNGDLSSPQAQSEWATHVQSPAMQFQADVALSKNLGNTLKDVGDRSIAAPDKWDQDATNGNIAHIRATPLSQLRGLGTNLTTDGLLVPQKSNLLDLTKDVLKNEPLDEFSQKIYDPNTGGYHVESTKTYLPERIKGLAYAAYNSKPAITDEVNKLYSKIDPYKQASLGEQAEIESKQLGRTVTPQELSYRDVLSGFNPKQQQDKGEQWTPQSHAYWNHFYKEGDEENGIRLIADNLKKAVNGDEKIWGPEVQVPDKTRQANAIVQNTGNGFSIKADAPTVQFSNVFNNWDLGQTSIPNVALNSDPKSPDFGKPLTKADGSPIITGYHNISNRVLNAKREDGKIYVQTTETQAQREQGKGDGWEQIYDPNSKAVSRNMIDKFVLNTKNPIKNSALLWKLMQEQGEAPASTKTAKTTTSSTQNGTPKTPTATRTAWKLNGWTDDQIEKAKKLGKISVDGE